MGAKGDPAHILKATITGAEVVNDHVEYIIVCSYHIRSTEEWTVRRRYKDFHRLNNDLEPFGFRLGLPPKKYFGNLSAAFIEQRKAQLQEFLNNITVHPLIYCTPTVAQFLELTEGSLKEYENYVLMSARNKANYRLISLWHGCGWRFYKLFASLQDVGQFIETDNFVLSWMPYGPDASVSNDNRSVQTLTDCLKFLSTLNTSYIAKSHDTYADRRGIGVIRRYIRKGTLRDRLYNSKPEDMFIRKYSMNRDCFVMNRSDAIFVARQLLEVISMLDDIGYPFYNFHCGNIAVNEDGCEVLDLEFALAGHSTFNRQALIRSKAQTLSDLRLYNFAQCFYEMITGTIVFPDHDPASALDSCPVDIFELLCTIMRPNSRMPTVQEIIESPIFKSVEVKSLHNLKILINKPVQEHFEKITKDVESRLKADREKFQIAVQKEHLHRFLGSEEERSRRRTIIQEYLRNNTTEVKTNPATPAAIRPEVN